ncbi:DUF4240 domain-containing protein [Plantactinospora sp. GCM10030261]|uniref:DUF4240 domain-containing protein n=1 Tax=Plantactinospora sp. GCM10030261 TaxID=3273420 RepID=UPI003622A78A
MRTDDFWAVIEQARAGDDGAAPAIAARAAAELADGEPDQIADWHRHLGRVLTASQQADLWGAAYLINGGCSADDFDNFRGWLIAQGRQVFARAVADPDSLADLPAVRQAATTGEEFGSADMLEIGQRAYAKATATELPPAVDPAERVESDDFWDFDDADEVRRRMPRLAELFGEPPLE